MNKFILSALLSVFSLGVFAQAAGFLEWVEVVNKADVNHDGMVSAHEVMMYDPTSHEAGFRPFMVDHFIAFDTNGDGMLTMDEIKAGMAKANMTDKDMSRAFFETVGFQPPKN
jgi:hypothetical protein